MNALARTPSLPARQVLGLLAVAEFMLTLDLSIVNVALPAIERDVGFSPGALQWVVNGYTLPFGGVLLLGGRAADLFGGRRVFLAALSVFTVASLACGLATGPGMLVAARAVQGLSAAALSPATLSMLTSTYRRSEQRNRALSVWTAVAIGGGAVGALLGGILTGGLSWRWIFFVNVPVGVLLLALAAARLPHATTQRQARLDVAGAVTVTGGLTALVWALVGAESTGWASTQVLGGLATAAALLAAFAVFETTVAAVPLVPFSVFGSRLVAAGNLTSFLSFAPVPSTWFFLTLYLQGVRGYAPILTGLIFLPVSLAVVGGSQLSFRVASRLGPRALFATGAVVAAAGLAWLGRISTATDLAWVILPACIAMIGGGLMVAPSTVAATAGGESDQEGLASGLLNTTRQIGGALGLAVLSSIAAISANRPGLPSAQAATSGYGTAFTVGAAIFLATALIGAIALPRRLSPPVDDELTPRQRGQTAHASFTPSGPSKPCS